MVVNLIHIISKDLYLETGIKRELTVPYKPQQNGVAERKNRTICEAAKAMMHDLDLPTSIWAEAAGTAVYVQNRCPHFILGDKTPEEKFTGVKLDVEHLRIFGCPMYIHVLKEKRSKMEPSGKKGIFVGTMKPQRLTGFIFQGSGILRSVGMLPFTRKLPSVVLGKSP